MAYVGNSPTQQSFTGGVDQYNGNNSNTVFGLTRTINTVYDVDVYVENVWQRPTTGYTVSANTITFTSAPPAGSNNVVIVYRNFAATSIIPQQGSVVTSSLGSITNINAGPSNGLSLQANSATAVTVAANGNVGIGTTTPNSAFHVAGNTGINVNEISSARILTLYPPRASNSAVIEVTGTGNGIQLRGNTSLTQVFCGANGNVGIGTIAPAALFHVVGEIRTSVSSNYATFNNNFLRSYAAGNYYFDNNTTGVDTVFRTSNASALDTTAMNVKASGVIDLPMGQIKFPATQNASADANTLDDYEEGTWTASYNNGTITSQSCQYTKVGRIVTATFGIQFTSTASSLGRISGLPFVISGVNYVGTHSREWYNTGNSTQCIGSIGSATMDLFFYNNTIGVTNGSTYGIAGTIVYNT